MEIFGIAPDKQMEVAKASGGSHLDSLARKENVRSAVQQGSSGSESGSPESELSKARIEQTAKELEASFEVKVELTREEDTGRTLVRIMSKDGQRVLRQMPPEGAIDLARRARQSNKKSLLTSVA